MEPKSVISNADDVCRDASDLVLGDGLFLSVMEALKLSV